MRLLYHLHPVKNRSSHAPRTTNDTSYVLDSPTAYLSDTFLEGNKQCAGQGVVHHSEPHEESERNACASIDWCPSGGGIPVIESSNSQGRAARQVALCGELGGFPVSNSSKTGEGGASSVHNLNVTPSPAARYMRKTNLRSFCAFIFEPAEQLAEILNFRNFLHFFCKIVAGLQVRKLPCPSLGLTHNLNLMANTRADTRCTTMMSGRNGDARFPIVPLDGGTDKPWEKPKDPRFSLPRSLSPISASRLSRLSRRNGSPGSLVARRRCAWTLLR